MTTPAEGIAQKESPMPNLPDHIDEMIERLKTKRKVPGKPIVVYRNPNGPEAAQLLSQCKDEIRRLEEENKLLSDDLGRALKRQQEEG